MDKDKDLDYIRKEANQICAVIQVILSKTRHLSYVTTGMWVGIEVRSIIVDDTSDKLLTCCIVRLEGLRRVVT